MPSIGIGIGPVFALGLVIPSNAIRDRTGSVILDRAGNFILLRS